MSGGITNNYISTTSQIAPQALIDKGMKIITSDFTAAVGQWESGLVGTGAITYNQDRSGTAPGRVVALSGTAVNDRALLASNYTKGQYSYLSFMAQYKHKQTATTADYTSYIGFSTTAWETATSYARFKINSVGAGAFTTTCECAAGGTATITAVAAINESDRLLFQVILNPGIVQYMINGTIVATHTTNVPTSTSLIAGCCVLHNATVDAIAGDIGYLSLETAVNFN